MLLAADRLTCPWSPGFARGPGAGLPSADRGGLAELTGDLRAEVTAGNAWSSDLPGTAN